LTLGFLGTGFVGEVYGSNRQQDAPIEISAEKALRELGFEDSSGLSQLLDTKIFLLFRKDDSYTEVSFPKFLSHVAKIKKSSDIPYSDTKSTELRNNEQAPYTTRYLDYSPECFKILKDRIVKFLNEKKWPIKKDKHSIYYEPFNEDISIAITSALQKMIKNSTDIFWDKYGYINIKLSNSETLDIRISSPDCVIFNLYPKNIIR